MDRNTLMGLRAKKLAEADALVKSADGSTLSDDDQATVSGLLDEVDGYDRDLARMKSGDDLLARLRGSGSAEEITDEGPAAATSAKSLGDFFVQTKGDQIGRLAAGRGTISTDSEWTGPGTKAATDPNTVPTGSGWSGYLTDHDRSIVTARREQLVVADLIGSGNVSGSHIAYPVEAADRYEGGFGVVPEGGVKPSIRYNTPEIVTESLSKLAGVTKITDEMFQDTPFLVSTINNDLLYDLGVAEEDQLLNGDGAGSNLTGILNRSGIQELVSDGAGDDLEAVFKARNAVRNVTPLVADAVVVSPVDYERFRLLTDGNGQYIAGGPFQGQYGQGGLMVEPPLWGLRTVVSNVLPAGTALVGAFRQAATLYRKGGVRVETTNANEDDFVRNLVAIRAEERLGLAVRRPSAFVKITFAGSSAGDGGAEGN